MLMVDTSTLNGILHSQILLKFVSFGEISDRKRYLPKYENIQYILMVDYFQIGTLNKLTN